jgi:hypothetical protein
LLPFPENLNKSLGKRRKWSLSMKSDVTIDLHLGICDFDDFEISSPDIRLHNLLVKNSQTDSRFDGGSHAPIPDAPSRADGKTYSLGMFFDRTSFNELKTD